MFGTLSSDTVTLYIALVETCQSQDARPKNPKSFIEITSGSMLVS